MKKLKIFCDDLKLIDNVVEEQLLIFGKIEENLIRGNNTFKNINKNDILNLIEYTDVKDCDFIYYPHKIFRHSKIDNLISLSEKYNKKILLFYNDDDDTIFNFKNSIIFRTSIYKSNKPKNYFSVPAFCNDLKQESKFFYREKNEIPTIGFCGAITHPIRKIVIDELEKYDLKTNLVIRDRFWGGDIWGDKVRNEYINNTLNSDIVICLRGAGNFSYRFYETLCLGRIPLVIDTDLLLPFEEFINYDDKIIKIQQDKILELYDIILQFWEKIEDYKSFQESLRFFWDNNLSPIGFINNLIFFKNEINNSLH